MVVEAGGLLPGLPEDQAVAVGMEQLQVCLVDQLPTLAGVVVVGPLAHNQAVGQVAAEPVRFPHLRQR